MGRYLLLWKLGIPLPVVLLIWLFGGLNQPDGRRVEVHPGIGGTLRPARAVDPAPAAIHAHLVTSNLPALPPTSGPVKP